MAKSRLELTAEREGKGDPTKTKQAYYRLQRQEAEETGDQALTDKIYKKLGKKSHNVDTGAVDKTILGSVAAGAAIPELGAVKGIARAVPALEKAGSKALSYIPEFVGRLTGKAGQAAMKNVTPAKKALSGPANKALPAAKSSSRAGGVAGKNLAVKTPVRTAEYSEMPKLKENLRAASKAKPNAESISSRTVGANPRSKGEHLRSKGANPRAKKKESKPIGTDVDYMTGIARQKKKES